jgi:NTP pyrophosphatase (non-canonical NTP hydrolase)
MQTNTSEDYQSLLLHAESKGRKNWTLDEWVAKIYSIYKENNSYRSSLYLWLQVSNEAGQLAENIRRGQITTAVKENLVNLFGWVCSFVGKYLYEDAAKNLSPDPISSLLKSGCQIGPNYVPPRYSSWILHKYPRACCACGEPFCICSAYRDTFERRKEGDGDQKHKSVILFAHDKIQAARNRCFQSDALESFSQIRLDDLIEEFISIYGGGHQDVDLWKIAAHFQEEVGEAAHEIVFLSELQAFDEQMKALGRQKEIDYVRILEEAFARESEPTLFRKQFEQLKEKGSDGVLLYLRTRSAETLKEELADVFSWISAMLGKVGTTFREIKREGFRRYEFWEDLSEKYYPERSLICPACMQSPCRIGCREVFFVRKTIREEVNQTEK